MKKFIKKNKNGIILTAAIVLPFGVVALGAWKAYELYKEKKHEDKIYRFDDGQYPGIDRAINGEDTEFPEQQDH